MRRLPLNKASSVGESMSTAAVHGGKKAGGVARKSAKGKTPSGSGIGQSRGRKSKFLDIASEGLARQFVPFGDYVSVVDAADTFGVATQTIRRWIKTGHLPEAHFPPGYTDRKLYMLVSPVIDSIERAAIRQAIVATPKCAGS